MRRLFTLTALLGLLALAAGCGESCLFRGEKPPAYQCAPVVEPGCGCGCAQPACGGCSTCAPGVVMPGPAS
jgi:hypothetical protein